MAVEIERKFLVKTTLWHSVQHQLTPQIIQQGYLATSNKHSIRVRIKGSVAFVTIKSKEAGLQRQEFEYTIPLADAQAMLSTFSSGLIQKKRYTYPFENHLWEIDVFEGVNQGLIVAEVELKSPNETIALPSFIGQEVSFDKRYRNEALSEFPYSKW